MSDPARKEATYADLLAVPAPLLAEFIRGTLITLPRPPIRHARAASQLSGELHSLRSAWVLLQKPELHLREEILVPDLAAWSRDRVPELPDDAFFTLAPDWVCEVLSPSTEVIDQAMELDLSILWER